MTIFDDEEKNLSFRMNRILFDKSTARNQVTLTYIN